MTSSSDNKFLIWAIIATHFAPPFMFSGVAVLLPTLGADLHAGATELGLVETMFLASQLAFLLPFGRLGDAADKKTLFKLGLFGFGVCSLLIGCLSSMPAILCLRFLQGISSAAFSSTSAALLADIVPPKQRGKAFGSSIGVIYSGLALGPICAGYLVELAGWRAVFMTGGAVLLAAFLLIHLKMPSAWRRPPAKSVHVPSTLLVVTSVLCLVAASSTLREGAIGIAFLTTSVVLAAAFVYLQRRLAQPLVDVAALMSNNVLRNSLAIQLLLYMNAFCSVFVLSIYMQVTLGHPAKTSGQVLAVGTILMAFVAPLAGRLADRFRPRVIATAGILCVLTTTLMGITLDADSNLTFIGLMLTIQGLGFGLFSSPNMTLIMGSVAPSATSQASALGAKARSLGMMGGMLVTALLLSLSIGNEPVAEHPAGFTRIIVLVFSMLTGLTLLALVISLFTGVRRTLGSQEISEILP